MVVAEVEFEQVVELRVVARSSVVVVELRVVARNSVEIVARDPVEFVVLQVGQIHSVVPVFEAGLHFVGVAE